MSEVHIGVTGTRSGMTDYQKASVIMFLETCIETVRQNNIQVVLHHGDCVGADVEVAEIARGLGCKIVCHPPIDNKLRGWYTSDETLKPRTYFERNRDIVDRSQMLLVVPYQMEWQAKCGTWYTHDYAKKKDVFLRVFWPERKIHAAS